MRIMSRLELAKRIRPLSFRKMPSVAHDKKVNADKLDKAWIN